MGHETLLERKRRIEAERQARVRDAFVEDVEWMAHTGESTEDVARRLGVRAQSVSKRLGNAGRSDLWEALRRNEVARFGETLGERQRREDSVAHPRAPYSATPRSVAC